MILLYPGDETGCGKIRLTWPGEMLQTRGETIQIDHPAQRRLRLRFEDGKLAEAIVPEGTECVVLQRPTHLFLAAAVVLLRQQGVAVVVDVDDDLHTVDPDNVAWLPIQPDFHKQALIRQGWRNRPGYPKLDEMVKNLRQSQPHLHSYEHLAFACEHASLVTVSTPRLLRRYAAHGRGVVLNNYLAEHYYGQEHVDSANIAWPASIHNHPNDMAPVGNAVARLLRENPGVTFTSYGEREVELANGGTATVGQRFKLAGEPVHAGAVDIEDWPAAIRTIGIGICPLANSTFNQSKSWLKGAELSAVGVPWVGSPRAEYRRLVARLDGQAGFLVDSVSDWYQTLRRLVREPGLRAEQSAAVQELAATLRLRDHVGEYRDAWRRAIELDATAPLAVAAPA